ncbi:MAG: hypothetical protein IPP67_07260 [Rhodospirillaceae bacterium]|nr:hypothetical protein [Rhodospirillaceae bacterium]
MPLVDMAAQVALITQNRARRLMSGFAAPSLPHYSGKGATWYGIGAGRPASPKPFLQDEHAVLTCCVRLPEVRGLQM